MKKNLKKISKVFVLALIMISIVSTLAYAVSDNPEQVSALPGMDLEKMAKVMAPSAIVALVITALHASTMLGWKPALRMVGISLVIVYVLEEIGVHTGFIFGRYHFTPLMGPKLDVIPVAIFCGWVTLIYMTWVVTNLLVDGSPTPTRYTTGMIIFKAILGALVITTIDISADPMGVANGWWVWLDGGPFYGVPIQNYVGWFIVAFVNYLAIGFQLRREKTPPLETASVGIRRLSIAPLVMFGLSGLSFISLNFAGQLGLVSVYLFGIPFLLATLKWIEWYKGLPKTSRH